jgi:FkbM family methyltransferase
VDGSKRRNEGAVKGGVDDFAKENGIEKVFSTVDDQPFVSFFMFKPSSRIINDRLVSKHSPDWLAQTFSSSSSDSSRKNTCQLDKLPFPIREVLVPVSSGAAEGKKVEEKDGNIEKNVSSYAPFHMFLYPTSMDIWLSGTLWFELGLQEKDNGIHSSSLALSSQESVASFVETTQRQRQHIQIQKEKEKEQQQTHYPDFYRFISSLDVWTGDKLWSKNEPKSEISKHGPFPSVFYDEGTHLEFAKSLQSIQKRKNFHGGDSSNNNNPNQQVPLAVVVGANIGLHALCFAALGFETHAFEPQVDNFNLLRCSAERNSDTFRSRLFLYPLAVDHVTTNSTSDCLIADFPNMATHRIVKSSLHDTRNMREKCEKIQTVTLDDFWTSSQLGQRRLDILLIDVDGFDLAVVQGGQQMFQTSPPCELYVEYAVHVLRASGVVPPSSYLQRILDYEYVLIGITNNIHSRHRRVDDSNRKELLEFLFTEEIPDGTTYFDLHFVHPTCLIHNNEK